MAQAVQVAAEAREAFNAHDEARIRSTYTPGVIFEAPGEVRLEGQEAVTEYAMTWLRAFPDAAITVSNEIASGDWIAQQFTFEGMHTAPLMTPEGEVAPTNRRLVGRGVQVFRVEGDRIAEEHLYFDQVQVMTQLGLMPEAALTTGAH